jgi:hypothetical protein
MLLRHAATGVRIEQSSRSVRRKHVGMNTDVKP